MVLSGCSSTVPQGAALAPAAHISARKPVTPTKILVVIEENHSFAEMQAGMPFLVSQAKKYGYAAHWQALSHPSEPNYLGIAGGSMFGVTDDAAPAVNAAKVGQAASVFSQAIKAGRTATTYAESVPTKCGQANNGNYAVRHNPWAYFASDRVACKAHDIGTSRFIADARANRLPNVGFLIPNLIHDAHDGTLAVADSWLKTELAPVLASKDFTSGKLVVVVTADEDDRLSGNMVLTSVLSSRLHHKVVTGKLNHYSLTRFIDQVLRVAPLRGARTAPDLRTLFGF
jgi:phospholipase C